MNRSTALARVLVDELVRGGVAEAVLSPGSRNAPLSYALHDAGRLRLHVRVDERSAGFLALGLARASGRPVPVITTSGTAVANLHPAVLEASYSGVPLLVLSADRPPELVGTGANQTIEQAGLFGAAVRLAAVAAGDEPERWRATVCRVLAAATGARTGDPGPVQLDVPLAEPLMPDGDGVPAGRDGGGPWTTVAPVSVDAPVPVDVGVPTLVIAGADAVSHPELARVPTVAEPGFALPPEVGVHPLAVAELSPEQVIVLGRPTLHRDVGRLLASGVPVTVLAPGRGWTDVAATAHAVGTRAQVHGASPPDWLLAAGSASVAARERVRAVLDADGPVTGLHVARAVVESVRPDNLLVLGSSNPVRDVSLVGNPTSRVLANRGVAGIDGTVSTAIGAALAHGGPTVALLGDLTLLHDANGLLIGPDEPRPNLTIVVADDDGGGIFTTLEQGAPERSAAFERVFGTPHGTDIGSLCRAHGVAHERVDVARLIIRLVDLYDGIRILEVPTHRSTRRQLHDALL